MGCASGYSYLVVEGGRMLSPREAYNIHLTVL